MKKMKRNILIQLFAALLGLSLGGLIAFGVTPKIHKDTLPKHVTRENSSQPGAFAGSPIFPSIPPRTTPRNQPQFAPDHIIVQFNPGIDTTAASQIVSQFGATLDGTVLQREQVTIYKVNIGPETAEDLVKKLSTNINVKYAEFDYIDHLN